MTDPAPRADRKRPSPVTPRRGTRSGRPCARLRKRLRATPEAASLNPEIIRSYNRSSRLDIRKILCHLAAVMRIFAVQKRQLTNDKNFVTSASHYAKTFRWKLRLMLSKPPNHTSSIQENGVHSATSA